MHKEANKQKHLLTLPICIDYNSHMRTTSDNFSAGQTPEYQHTGPRTNQEANHTSSFNQQNARSQGEDFARKAENQTKTKFNFSQKAGFVGLGVTALFMMIKSKFLTLIAGAFSAAALYFGFKGKAKDNANQAELEAAKVEAYERAQAEAIAQRNEKEAQEILEGINSRELKGDVATFRDLVAKVIESTKQSDNSLIAQTIHENQASNKFVNKNFRALTLKLHPDKINGDKYLKYLFKVATEVKELERKKINAQKAQNN
jgi:hypothetical protein